MKWSQGRALVLAFLVFLLLLALVLLMNKLSYTGAVAVEQHIRQTPRSATWHVLGKVLVEEGKVAWFDYLAD